MQQKSSLWPLFLTIFIDMLGVGIVIPILASIFFDNSVGLVDPQATASHRSILLGFLVATYPLAQFFGAPFLGALADRYGRKKLLLISLLGTFFGYLLFGWGIAASSLIVLFISRALDGFTGGNISIALSAIADLSDSKTKAKNFGLIGMAFGFGFIIGPYIGGKLADPSIVSWFNYATPAWFAMLLTVINIFFVQLRFQETLKAPLHTPLTLLTGPRNIARAFSMKNLRTLFIVMFLFTFGFNFFTQFFQVFLIQKFAYTQSQIGDLFAYIGLWIAFTQGVVMRLLAKYFKPQQLMRFSLLSLAVTLPLLLIPDRSSNIYFILPFIALSNGITYPNSTALISNTSDPKSQGEILGINQSIQALGMAIPPIIAGFIVSIDRNLPILVAGICTFVAWLVFIIFFKESDKKEFHEV